jgi:hypothetical protein
MIRAIVGLICSKVETALKYLRNDTKKVESANFGTEFGLTPKIFVVISVVIIPVAVLLFYANIIHLIILTIMLVVAISMSIAVIVPVKNTSYTLGDDALIINFSAPFNEPPIKYSSIRKIIIGNELTVLGYSTKCVTICHADRKRTSISPKNREEFVMMLKERCPQALVERNADK